MALVTTIGSKRANSWVTATEASTILTDAGIYDSTAWTALAAGGKELRLYLACKAMKSEFSFVGYPVYENQALPFPCRFLDTDTIEIPDDIKKVQTFIAYGVIHRRLADISNPNDGPSFSDDISSLSLFGVSMTAASGPLEKIDDSLLETIIRSEHMHIYLLLQDYVTQVVCTKGPTGPRIFDPRQGYMFSPFRASGTARAYGSYTTTLSVLSLPNEPRKYRVPALLPEVP